MEYALSLMCFSYTSKTNVLLQLKLTIKIQQKRTLIKYATLNSIKKYLKIFQILIIKY